MKVSGDAQKIYAQQEQILPALHHEHMVDPARTEHLHEVGRHVFILREHAKKPSKQQQKILEKSAPKRVIPSRFGEEGGNDDQDDDPAEDQAILDGRIVRICVELRARFRCGVLIFLLCFGRIGDDALGSRMGYSNMEQSKTAWSHRDVVQRD